MESNNNTPDQFSYCQREIEEQDKCKTQCDHCKVYYRPLEDEISLQEEAEAALLIEAREWATSEGYHHTGCMVAAVMGYRAAARKYKEIIYKLGERVREAEKGKPIDRVQELISAFHEKMTNNEYIDFLQDIIQDTRILLDAAYLDN
jgi:hypothetical protein